MKAKTIAKLALALAIILVLAVIGAVIGFVGQSKCWFGHDYDETGICTRCGAENLDDIKPDDKNEPAEDSDDAEAEIVVSPANTKVLRFAVAPIASDNPGSKTVSVTNVVDGFVYEWSLSSGGNEYVTLSANTGTSVNVSVKKAFGTEITLTCTAKYEGQEISSGTCTIGYYKRPSGITFGGVDRADGTNIDLGTYLGVTTFLDMFKGTLDFSASSFGTVSFGTGTEDVSVSATTITLTESDSDFSYIFYGPTFDIRKAMAFSELYYRWYCVKQDMAYNESNYINWRNQMNMLASQGIYQPFATMYSDISGKTFTITCSVMSSEVGVSNVTITLTVPTNLTIPGTAYEPSLSDSNIVF